MTLEKRTLGRTGLKVTALGYGAMEVRGSRIWGGRPVTEEQAETILNAVLDAGNQLHRHGQRLRPQRRVHRQIHVGTSVGIHSGDEVRVHGGSQGRQHGRHATRLDAREPVPRPAREPGADEDGLCGHHAAPQPDRRAGGAGRPRGRPPGDEAAGQGSLDRLLLHPSPHHLVHRMGRVRRLPDSLLRAWSVSTRTSSRMPRGQAPASSTGAALRAASPAWALATKTAGKRTKPRSWTSCARRANRGRRSCSASCSRTRTSPPPS